GPDAPERDGRGHTRPDQCCSVGDRINRAGLCPYVDQGRSLSVGAGPVRCGAAWISDLRPETENGGLPPPVPVPCWEPGRTPRPGVRSTHALVRPPQGVAFVRSDPGVRVPR